jgi:MFS family permease
MLAIWVVYLTDFRDLTLTQVGIMEGLFWAVKLAAEVPSGAFADRYGRRLTFITGIGFESVGTVVFAFAGDFYLLAISYVVWSAGLAFRSGNDEAYLFDALAAGDRETEYTDRLGMYWALNTVALLGGGVAGGVLAAVTSLQVAVLAALIPFALALPVLLAMEEPPRRSHTTALTMGQTLRRGVAAVMQRPELRSILILQVALSGVFPAFFLLSQPFLDAHGVSLALFGVLAIPVHLARTGAGLMSGRVTRRFGLPATLAVAVAGAVAGLVTLSLINHVVAFAGLAAAMAAVSLAMPAIGAYVNERTESNVRATVLSLAPMGTSLMMGAMSVAAGTVAAASLRLSFGVMGIVILALAGYHFFAWLAAHSASTRVASVQTPTEVPEPEPN